MLAKTSPTSSLQQITEDKTRLHKSSLFSPNFKHPLIKILQRRCVLISH